MHITLHYTTLQSREFSIQNTILHTEDKELFEYYYYIQRAKRPSFQIPEKKFYAQKARRSSRNPSVCSTGHSRHSATRPSKGIQSSQTFQSFQSFQTFRTFQSFMTFQPFQAILQILHCSSISRESTPFQHSPIRMHILQFDWFPQKLHRVPVEQLQITNIHSSKKGRCCDIGQIDIFSRIELIPSFVLSSDNTNCKNDIQ